MNKEEFIEYVIDINNVIELTDDVYYGKKRIYGHLYLEDITEIPEGFNPWVGGSLSLSSLTSIPKGFNPKVGSCLTLSSLTSIPVWFNPVVGDTLYLDSLKKIPENWNPTNIEGKIVKRETNIKPIINFINFHI